MKTHLWVLLDISNGNKPVKNYCWLFISKKRALEHKKHQNSNKNYARLVGPYKISSDIELKQLMI